MKITLVRDDGKVNTLRTLKIELLLEQMKTEVKAQPVSKMREALRYTLPGNSIEGVRKVPKVIPAAAFVRKKVRGFVEKAKSGFAHSAEIPVEERRRRLEKFLDERPMIRRKEYTQLTGLLKNKALNELNGWVKEGVLDTIGSGSHIIYVRANTGKD